MAKVWSNNLAFRDAWEHFAGDSAAEETDWALFGEDDLAWNPEFVRDAEARRDRGPDWGLGKLLEVASHEGLAFLGICRPSFSLGLKSAHTGIVTNGRVEMRKGCGTCAHAVCIYACFSVFFYMYFHVVTTCGTWCKVCLCNFL